MNIETILKQLKISYQKIEHQPVYTAAKANFINELITGMPCKNLFLKNSNNQYFIYTLPAKQRADLKQLASHINSKRLHFASPEELYQYLKLTPGTVTPLGIINDKHIVKVLLDHKLVNQYLLVHPNINTATISISYDDLLVFIKYCGNDYTII